MAKCLLFHFLVLALTCFSGKVFSQIVESDQKLINLILHQSQDLEVNRIPSEELHRVDVYIRSLGIDWSFELDGCDQRARMVAYGLHEEMGLQVGMIKALAPSDQLSRFIPHSPFISWSYHKAAFVFFDDRPYVIDYSLFDQITPLNEWLNQLGIKSESQIELEDRYSTPQPWDEENFKLTKNRAPKFYHKQLATPELLMSQIWNQIQSHTFMKKHISEIHSFWGNPFQFSEAHYQDLLQGTRCSKSAPQGKEAHCTSYIPLENQTCYFHFKVNEDQFVLTEATEDLICF